MIWRELELRDRVQRNVAGVKNTWSRPFSTVEVAAVFEEVDRLRAALRASCHHELGGNVNCFVYRKVVQDEGRWDGLSAEARDELICAACKALEGAPK